MSSNYNRKDHFYEKAKEEGFRSRAAYKLIELDEKFRLFKPNAKVLDLGAWPGGWLQVAAERVGPGGRAVGIDLTPIEALPQAQVHLLEGDVASEETIAKAEQLASGKFDLVLSDMSPKLSGIREVDEAQTVQCAELAWSTAKRCLKSGGDLLIKVFKSNETDQFVKNLKGKFKRITRAELDATRKTSNEYYLVAQGFTGKA